jgi:hypothetical protein
MKVMAELNAYRSAFKKSHILKICTRRRVSDQLLAPVALAMRKDPRAKEAG